MAVDDYLEPEVAVTAAVTAVIFSPQGRKILRKGAVYGLAGLLVAGDALSSLGRSIGQGLQRAGASASEMARPTSAPSQNTQEPPQTKGEYESPGGQH
jgi:hypothetical protein